MDRRNKQQCKKCGGKMHKGIALKSTYVGTVTLRYGGPGVIIPVMKCARCGYSVSW